MSNQPENVQQEVSSEEEEIDVHPIQPRVVRKRAVKTRSTKASTSTAGEEVLIQLFPSHYLFIVSEVIISFQLLYLVHVVIISATYCTIDVHFCRILVAEPTIPLSDVLQDSSWSWWPI
jgi:hypothetical protein